jgi:hypothetical protein
MENPATWTPLHHKINTAYYTKAKTKDQKIDSITDSLREDNYNVSREDVVSAISAYEKSSSSGLCGLSFPSTIIQGFFNKKA